ncbi:uncharacterized protein LOC119309066 [Triticum dicoccoides]|uniref:uncharacterized protein LOC119309066 n=1 Tax=Triticum dicoccoides TaxID=85692 RepID=UPI001891843E|nr:uncharacterized protein LOC119309066 [Triticum dicoccoides]
MGDGATAQDPGRKKLPSPTSRPPQTLAAAPIPQPGVHRPYALRRRPRLFRLPLPPLPSGAPSARLLRRAADPPPPGGFPPHSELEVRSATTAPFSGDPSRTGELDAVDPRGLGSSPHPASMAVSCHPQHMRPRGSDGCSRRGGGAAPASSFFLEHDRLQTPSNSRDPPYSTDANAWERCYSGGLLHPRVRHVDNSLLAVVPSSIPEHNSDEPVDRFVIHSTLVAFVLFCLRKMIFGELR